MNGEDLKEITLTNGWGTISTDRSDDLVVDLVGGEGGEREPGATGERRREEKERKKKGRAGGARAAET
jgi:hypothetical protein